MQLSLCIFLKVKCKIKKLEQSAVKNLNWQLEEVFILRIAFSRSFLSIRIVHLKINSRRTKKKRKNSKMTMSLSNPFNTPPAKCESVNSGITKQLYLMVESFLFLYTVESIYLYIHISLRYITNITIFSYKIYIKTTECFSQLAPLANLFFKKIR